MATAPSPVPSKGCTSTSRKAVWPGEVGVPFTLVLLHRFRSSLMDRDLWWISEKKKTSLGEGGEGGGKKSSGAATTQVLDTYLPTYLLVLALLCSISTRQ
jgi:hypothetical protein